MPPAFDISFCIPTYNFGQYIGETLDSIICQADDRVQIVIVDGGSTDDTASVVAERSRVFPNIKFIQRQQRSGVDRDILESVAQAEGEYCWLFSSDDVLAPGAVKYLRAQMSGEWNVLLADHALCDLQMRRVAKRRIFPLETTTTFDWSIPAERLRYLETARGDSTAFFSFISAVVVRRANWAAAGPQTEFVGSCWIIAAQIFAMARQRLVVRYCPDELVDVRSGNDSFLSLGMVNRLGLSIDGFRKVAEFYFGSDSVEARHVSRILKTEHPLLPLIGRRLRIEDTGERRRFEALMRRQFDDGSLADTVQRQFGLAPLWVL
ncbi:MAG: glycosyltransferase family 2 protein, partial [Planctomycetaceae bacterium]